MTRTELDSMRDDVYVLACAVGDVERDLTGEPTISEYRDAIRWLIESAKPLISNSPHS